MPCHLASALTQSISLEGRGSLCNHFVAANVLLLFVYAVQGQCFVNSPVK